MFDCITLCGYLFWVLLIACWISVCCLGVYMGRLDLWLLLFGICFAFSVCCSSVWYVINLRVLILYYALLGCGCGFLTVNIYC